MKKYSCKLNNKKVKCSRKILKGGNRRKPTQLLLHTKNPFGTLAVPTNNSNNNEDRSVKSVVKNESFAIKKNFTNIQEPISVVNNNLENWTKVGNEIKKFRFLYQCKSKSKNKSKSKSKN